MSYTILLVEDDPRRAEALQRPLAAAGCNVVLADANLGALEIFERIRPDLVMIEAVAPDSTGLELCQALKETPQGRATPVIVVAETRPGECRRAQVLDRYRCDAFISIPIAGALLVENCVTLIESRQGVGDEDPDLLATLDELDAATDPPDRELLASALHRLEEEIDATARAASSATAPTAEEGWTDPLTASLEELSRVADDLVDRLPFEEESASVNRPAPSSPEEMRETIDQLSQLAEAMEAPESEMEVAVDGDRGDDIAGHLDALFSGGHPAPVEAPRAAPFEAPIAPARSTPPGVIASPAAVASPAVVVPPADVASSADVASPAIAAAAVSVVATQLPITPKYYEPSGHLSQPERRSIWPIAAGLAVLMLGGAAWVLRPPTAELPVISSSSSPTVPPVGAAQSWGTSALTTPAAAGTSAAAETPTPTPGGEGVFGTPALQEPAEIEPALPDAASALTPTGSVAIQKVPSPPVASRETTAATKTKPQPTAPPVRSTPVEAPVAARELADALPPPPPPNIGGPRRATADSTVASTPQIDSVTRAGSGAVVRTVVRPESTAPTPDTAPAASAPVQTPPSGTTPTPTQSAITTPAIAQIDLSPPPATDRPSIVESAGIPSYRPPTPIQSPQPSYPPRALKRGDQGTIVLKVLVNEEGRVTRVVVDQGIAGSELEAAAIDAVLRWTYQPASEYGRPIKGWTTERFVFTPPSSKAD